MIAGKLSAEGALRDYGVTINADEIAAAARRSDPALGSAGTAEATRPAMKVRPKKNDGGLAG
jgi:hypothetical protein